MCITTPEMLPIIPLVLSWNGEVVVAVVIAKLLRERRHVTTVLALMENNKNESVQCKQLEEKVI